MQQLIQGVLLTRSVSLSTKRVEGATSRAAAWPSSTSAQARTPWWREPSWANFAPSSPPGAKEELARVTQKVAQPKQRNPNKYGGRQELISVLVSSARQRGEAGKLARSTSATNLVRLGSQRWRDLSDEQKAQWTERASARREDMKRQLAVGHRGGHEAPEGARAGGGRAVLQQSSG
jgi:hypothetical protein